MQKLQLSIPEPCHENWQQMTPTEQGRYCNACAKEVIDFSMMTDTEVLNYFTHITHDKVCGRALPSQLDRAITHPKEPKKRLFWYWNYIVMFLMFFSKSNNAKAQGNVRAVTASELSIVSPSSVYDALTGREAGQRILVVNGKVTGIDGNPVSFATIKIKGTSTGLSADVKGGYSIRVKRGDVLVISGAGFKETEVPVGVQKNINVVLEKELGEACKLTVVFTKETCNSDFSYYVGSTESKHTAVLQVKDDKSGLSINKAKVFIAKEHSVTTAMVVTNKKGFCKLKHIKKDETYFIKVEADGYNPNEFTIDAADFSDRKEKWEVLLVKKQVVVPVAERTKRKYCPGATVQLGGVSVISDGIEPIYVVDGIFDPEGSKIKPEDIEDIKIFHGPEAAALFGSGASNGAIVITTRKTKVKDLKEVVVTDYYHRSIKGAMGAVSYIRNTSVYNELKARANTLLTDSIKVFPNPVQRNSSLNVSLKLKQAGNHSIQVADVSGRIILQKQINAQAKNHMETLTADSKWSGGVYYIRVFNNKNQLISKSSFIVR